MRIIDENGNELENVDWHAGYGVEETIVIAHHDAQEQVSEQAHYVTIREYPNGGKDVVKIIDVPFQPYKPAWDETETILRWHWYAKNDPRRVDCMAVSDNVLKGEYFYANCDLYLATETIPKGFPAKPYINCLPTEITEVIRKQEEQNGKTDL